MTKCSEVEMPNGRRAAVMLSLADGTIHDGVDLRGADLRGLRLSRASLVGARLDGADLSDAHLQRVDLSGAVLTGVNLTNARLELVQAGSATLSLARAQQARFENVSLVGAELHGTDLRQATLRLCDLSSSSFVAADLRRATLRHCLAEGINLSGARLMWTSTLGSSFRDADLTDARQYFLCRELIVELLRRECEDDFERAKLLGAIVIARTVCYAEWQKYLARQKELLALALAIFDRHPKSGLTVALRLGRITAEFGTEDVASVTESVTAADETECAASSPVPID